MSREQVKSITTIFPQTQQGCCRVCKEECPGRRRTYCSENCKKIANATQKFFLWKTLRKKVLKRDNWTCQECGENKQDKIDHFKEEKPDLVERMGEPDFDHKFHADHIKPVSKGGKVFDMDNLQVLCEDCNLSKSDKYNGKKTLNDFYDGDIGQNLSKGEIE